MERTTKHKEKRYYQKIGKGSFRTKTGRIIKPNEKFYEFPENISDSFKDLLISLDGDIDIQIENQKDIDSQKIYSVEKKGGGYYNVVNSEGKVQNEKGLKHDDAEELAKVLNS